MCELVRSEGRVFAWKMMLGVMILLLAGWSSVPAQAGSASNWVHSNWIKNLSGAVDPNGLYHHTTPRIAIAGSYIHVVWLGMKNDFTETTLFYRRSNDRGKTFEPTVRLATSSSSAGAILFPETWNSVVAGGRNLHVFYVMPGNALMYARSENAGVSFTKKTLSKNAAINGFYAAARDQQLQFAWATGTSAPYNLNIYSSYSIDSGKTIRTTRLAHADDNTATRPYLYTAEDIAVSGSYVYVLGVRVDENWFSTQKHLYLWGSSDGGKTFKRPLKVNLKAVNGGYYLNPLHDHDYSPSLAAEGKNVNIVWSNIDNPGSFDGWQALTLRTRRSTDGGATLQKPKTLFTYPEGYNSGALSGLETVARAGANVFATTVMKDALAGTYFWRSLDGGATWSKTKRIGAGGWWPEIAVDPSRSSRLFVADSWLYRSTNSGASFDGGFGPRDETAWEDPQLAIDALGTPHYTWSASTRGYLQSEILYRALYPPNAPDRSANRAVRLTHVASSPNTRPQLQIPATQPVNVGKAMTAELWIKRLSDEWPFYENLYFKARSTGDGSFELGVWSDFQIYGRLVTTDTDQYYGTWMGTGVKLEKGKWTHIAMTYDSAKTTDNWRLYVNGNLMAKQTLTGTIVTDQGRLLVGDPNPWGGSGIAEVDEVRLWNVARTAQQINAKMRSPLQGNETGLIVYLNLNRSFLNLTGKASSAFPRYKESFVYGPSFIAP